MNPVARRVANHYPVQESESSGRMPLEKGSLSPQGLGQHCVSHATVRAGLACRLPDALSGADQADLLLTSIRIFLPPAYW